MCWAAAAALHHKLCSLDAPASTTVHTSLGAAGVLLLLLRLHQALCTSPTTTNADRDVKQTTSKATATAMLAINNKNNNPDSTKLRQLRQCITQAALVATSAMQLCATHKQQSMQGALSPSNVWV